MQPSEAIGLDHTLHFPNLTEKRVKYNIQVLVGAGSCFKNILLLISMNPIKDG